MSESGSNSITLTVRHSAKSAGCSLSSVITGNAVNLECKKNSLGISGIQNTKLNVNQEDIFFLLCEVGG